MPYIAVQPARGRTQPGSKHVSLGATKAVGGREPGQVYLFCSFFFSLLLQRGLSLDFVPCRKFSLPEGRGCAKNERQRP